MQNPDPSDRTIYCDLCCLQPSGALLWQRHAGVALWDAPIIGGQWAYVCRLHRHQILSQNRDQFLLRSARQKKGER